MFPLDSVHSLLLLLLQLYHRLRYSHLSNKIMLNKNCLKRKSTQELSKLAENCTCPLSLLNCQQIIEDKNKALLAQKQAIEMQISDHRCSIKNVINELQDSMKQKIKLRERLVMNKNSRPDCQDISKLSSKFTVAERQNQITSEKDKVIIDLSTQCTQALQKLIFKNQKHQDCSKLDEQYNKLSKQCDQEEAILKELVKQREQQRKFYNSIKSEFDSDIIEDNGLQDEIEAQERVLVQLSSYWDNRSRQNKEQLTLLQSKAEYLQQQILKSQTMLGLTKQRNSFLAIQMPQRSRARF